MNFPDWKFQVLNGLPSLKVPNFSLFGRAKFIEFDAMVYKSSVLPPRVFLASLIQGAIIKQGAKIMQPLEDAGIYNYIYICMHTQTMEKMARCLRTGGRFFIHKGNELFNMAEQNRNGKNIMMMKYGMHN